MPIETKRKKKLLKAHLWDEKEKACGNMTLEREGFREDKLLK